MKEMFEQRLVHWWATKGYREA